jgi:hypothetical protein
VSPLDYFLRFHNHFVLFGSGIREVEIYNPTIISSTSTTIITNPEHMLHSTPLPQKIDIIRQVRTGKVKPSFSTSEPSGIYKTPHSKPVKVAILVLEGDESAYIPHTGPDNVIIHYSSQQYAL